MRINQGVAVREDKTLECASETFRAETKAKRVSDHSSHALLSIAIVRALCVMSFNLLKCTMTQVIKI